MDIVFRSDIGEASPITGMGFFAGMIFDEPRGIFGHFNFDAFQIILFKDIIESQNTPLLSLCKGPKCDLVG
jgi:hypothetical protein